MMRSLYSGVSGLRVHQTKMDVIGNNISNVNTVGFKASTVNFSDIFYQTTQSATGPNAQTGAAGQNAKQIGLGANLASIKTQITTRGGAQRTDNPFDIMISDDSFFIVNSGGTNYFTKSGAFEVDAGGTLCTSDGATVMGWQVDPTDPTKIVANQVSALRIMSPENLLTEPAATEKTYFTGNIDQNDTQLVDGKPTQMQFYDNLGNLCTAKFELIELNPPIEGQYNMNLIDILGPNDKSIFATFDGTKYVKSTTTTAVSFGGISYTVGSVDEETGLATITGGTQTAGTNTITFNPGSGAFVQVGTTANAKSTSLTITSSSTGLYKPIDVDFSTMTMYATSGKSSISSTKGGLDGTGAGKKVGNMTGVSVDAAGKIYGTYDNGDQKLLGQIAVASFSNPAGLEAVGNNRFAETQNSGGFDGIGKDISASGGNFSTGVLEMSNVDLSAQFTDMIVTQRGFQANSRIITTSDSLLEELINLKR
ncbi:flagellar hook protein FlgE [Mobilisporobacter senegalensis]|uniref:Flagellar hook protein FlgE n=1 Tax=Mobilisporobacter senegalensis TaxID=1329262 RepID=A0A3N1XVX5_9FIRM|nr:flagellar hook-basal body complex protein [Mobilisporobacter senegalensis]ROR30770.1 flagellar hook protein FlgE [Mobilisporobacter senegalensis]